MPDKNYVIWGVGKEGRAAQAFITAHLDPLSVTFVDENPQAGADVIHDADAIERAVLAADVVVKSPGVSLYHPVIVRARAAGVKVTSLLNLWFARRPAGRVVAITGTKGKSTTSALLGHVLNRLGHKTAVLGNIGVPVSEAPEGMDVLVLELSSYQCADFDGHCDIAAVTSLYPEHLNWHGTLDRYYGDKMRLLARADVKIVHPQVRGVWPDLPADTRDAAPVDALSVPNDYLRRAHNLANVGIVVTVAEALGICRCETLKAMAGFAGLPHRQQELGEADGRLFVDDSIATTPQAAMAAMDVYRGRAITLIAGGFDRGIDYQPLAEYVCSRDINAVIGLGESGARILAALAQGGYSRTDVATDMDGAVAAAVARTPAGGVVLLSPAAPSFGLFRDYIARGQAFARAAGFNI